MGEIAEMMLDGTMCEGCGEFLDNPLGYPTRCAACSPEFPDAEKVVHVVVDGEDPKTVKCPNYPNCFRRFRTRESAAQHWLDKHD